ncbi:MAG: RagB/SusD family nutrient uptake outer membrane protein [Cyclobacteriaceae bacterium]
MKNIKYIFLLSGLLACTDLEEQVFSEASPANFYGSIADAEAAVIPIYEALNRPVALWDFGMLSMTFMPAPHTQTRVGWRRRWADYTTSASDGVSLPRVWPAIYRSIFRANTAIANLENKTFEDTDDDARRAVLVAEAKWLRAWNFFNLVRLFGDVPMPLTPATSVEEAQLPATSVADVYTQIIADLQAAESGLPPTPRAGGDTGRPIQGTAKFLLAKVYLTMAGLPLNDASKMSMAHAKIKEVIDGASGYGYELLADYETAIRVDNNAERIFAVQQTQAVTSQGTALSFVWGGPNWPWGNGGQYHGGCTREFYESYEATDVRRDVSWAYTYVGRNGDTMIYGAPGIDGNGDGNASIYGGNTAGVPNETQGIAPNKYHDADQGCCDGDPDILIYRYADALLMYAEAENALNGPTGEAYTYLNMVRTRGGASTFDPAAGLTKDQFQELIYNERFLELSFEFHEVFDMRRLGKIQEAIETNFEANKINATYKPAYELWPIPLSEIQANPNLEQNDGW